MSQYFLPSEITDIPLLVSAQRFSTYLKATHTPSQALRLYQWNALVSSSFIYPIHIFEVMIRNAAVEAIESVYGPAWPMSQAFLRSMPQKKGYCPNSNLRSVSGAGVPVGRVITKLKFAFWVAMFTSRYDRRIWDNKFHSLFPYAPTAQAQAAPQSDLRAVHLILDSVREFRNRIAHHEPIFNRDLDGVYNSMLNIVRWRFPSAADWVDQSQNVMALLRLCPL